MQLKNATILIVDDEPDLRDILTEWFRREGSRVLVAEDGAEALKFIEENQVDVVISDVRMPIMDGIALLRKVKASATYKASVMFISGYTDIEPRDAYDLGVEAVIAKPVERKNLMAIVARVLAERAELWSVPPEGKADAILDASFASVEVAMSQKQIAFGRGGFCVHSEAKLKEGPVDLLLEFRAEKRRVQGRGVIRWVAAAEPDVGVEITYIDADNRAWILSLTGPNESHSFIPRAGGVAVHTGMEVRA
jgi:CheY-like chemotaxis protein